MSAAADARMFRPEAVAIARDFIALLEGAYEQLVVAGSLRRRLAYVGDIEIVAVPKIVHEPNGLFEGYTQAIDKLDFTLQQLLSAGHIQKRFDAAGSPRWGARLKYLTFRGAPVDLFAPEAGQFGWHLLLRTGPAAFSRQLVVAKLDDNGRPGRTKDRRPGLMPTNLVAEGGWLRYRASREPIATPTEQSVFDLFGLPFREAWERM